MGKVVTVSTVLWDRNKKSAWFSPAYTDDWARKFFAGFRRYLTVETRSVLFTDRQRDLPSFIEQVIDPVIGSNGYGDCIQPFQLDEPMIFAGLDTVVVGNCDKFARYCLEADCIALPKHPYEDISINGVVLCPAGQRRIFDEWRGENDMKWLRKFSHNRTDQLWPGRIVSYKAHVRGRIFPSRARIVYFHGEPKPSELSHEEFVRKNWV